MLIKKEWRILLIWTVFVKATFFSIKEVRKNKIGRTTSCQGQVLDRIRVLTHQHTSQVKDNVDVRIFQSSYTKNKKECRILLICSSGLFFHKGTDEEDNLSRSSVGQDESNNTPTYDPGRRKCWGSDFSVFIYLHHVLLMWQFLIIFWSILINQWWVTQGFIDVKRR